MAAAMDLDLNCSPPSPEPAAQDEFKRAMLRQNHTFRHQVKDLHRLYWAHKNLTGVPFWKQSDDVLYARHSLVGCSDMDMIDLEGTESPDVDDLGHSYGLGNEAALLCRDEVSENFGIEGSVRKKPDGFVQGRSAYGGVIDLEKPATLDDSDDDVAIVSSAVFSAFAKHNSGVLEDPKRQGLENTTQVCSGLTRSSDTPDSHSPVKAKTNASGRMIIDLNIAQEDNFDVYPDPSEVLCSLLASTSTVQSGERRNNSSKAFHKESESSIESSKGSSITVVASISAPDSLREVAAAGFYDPQSTSKPFYVEGSKSDALLCGNVHQQHTVDKIYASGSQMSIPRELFSVRSRGGSCSTSGLHELEGKCVASVTRESAVVHGVHQEETLTIISDDEFEGFDLNVSVGSIELPSTIGSSREKCVNNDGTKENLSSHYFNQDGYCQNIPSSEYAIIRDRQMVKGMDGKSVRCPDSGTAINRPGLIPETPQARDYACPRLRSSNTGASNPLCAIDMHQAETEEDKNIAATAAETLVALFTNNSTWIADSHCSNSQTDAPDGSLEPQVPLDSFEEGVMNLEELKDDGESIPVTASDKDGPSCGIKLKRGRGMRDFQREILPGVVSLARHEICDDLHAIGYEIRKTRLRRGPGDKCSLSTRSRLPRRCSNAWN